MGAVKTGMWQVVPEKPLHEVVKVKPGMRHRFGDLRAIRYLSTHKKGYRQRENQSEREMCFKKQSWKGIHGVINQSLP